MGSRPSAVICFGCMFPINFNDPSKWWSKKGKQLFGADWDGPESFDPSNLVVDPEVKRNLISFAKENKLKKPDWYLVVKYW